ncbi:bifunctional 3,4-dihydroxy-2-butanone-4-phosphate synthase/GTP cyclohydrolase II [Nocardia sp. NBC_00508]|uniref:bifunctional 3,4-dihydroxy-2-butanone-4-phosphate synthase/GTP cyclohydrolase II n=1 Tax=Nocardia sp. NBC_00508 TaxID=2975992 RepID=UPI002E7FD904|nr:bifunctional 3,4-dihydroxy-2-butanone-4-phosphate synthase/GTP cyclohydrolase II [Nocardia sp. NBC_00508]WUD67102.1 bifunctional 3,4-dihydroxy-2-butanone-4-phosphate synthase/GTP cyclohydrolase II [Nocardia sp. NBC_00508]
MIETRSSGALQARGSDAADRAIAAIARGEIVVVVDAADRENEGDLVIAAQYATPERMAFFVRHTSGLICAAVTEARADELHLPLMVDRSQEPHKTAFTVTVDYRHGTTTGISAADRSATARALVGPETHPSDFTRPGHLHVLRARNGGVLTRPGHTEAAVDLARLAGLYPAGVICELVSEDGSEMMRGPDLYRFAAEHELTVVTIEELISARYRSERIIERVAEARLPTSWGDFTAIGYVNAISGEQHLALVLGDVAGCENTLVRVHSECLTGDVFGSLKCDCGDQLDASLRSIAEEGRGVVVYVRGHEGRGIGLVNKIRAYALQDQGYDTVDANLALGLAVDARDYRAAGQILRDLGVVGIRCMTNNPAKYAALEDFGFEMVERIPMRPRVHAECTAYLRTKRERMGHL